jgi:hypothetical protein
MFSCVIQHPILTMKYAETPTEKEVNISWKSLVQSSVSSDEQSTVMVAVNNISFISCVMTNLIRKASGKLPLT